MTLRFNSMTSMFVFVGLVVGWFGYFVVYRTLRENHAAAQRQQGQREYQELRQHAAQLTAACMKPVDAALRRHVRSGIDYAPLKPSAVAGPLPFLPVLTKNSAPVPAQLDGGRVCEVTLPQKLRQSPDWFEDDVDELRALIAQARSELRPPQAPDRFGVISTRCVSYMCWARLGVISTSGGLEALVEANTKTKYAHPSPDELEKLSSQTVLLATH
jgi:hypothetical protein